MPLFLPIIISVLYSQRRKAPFFRGVFSCHHETVDIFTGSQYNDFAKYVEVSE